MHAAPWRRVLAAGLGAGLSAIATLLPAAPSLASAPTVTRGDPAAARDWLTAQLRSDGSMPASLGSGSDEGLGIDTLWALQATGASGSAVRRVWAALATPAAVDDFTGPGYYRQAGMPGARFGGQSAKLLLAAATVGADVTGVGGRDLRRQTLDLVEASGPEAGRVRDTGTGVDNSNLIGQALAVMGLAATGPLPATTVGYLSSQQCSAGFFRLYNNDGRSCDAAAVGNAPVDNDATAFGVQALMAAAAADGGSAHAPATVTAGIRRGLAYLASAQHANGSFSGGVGTAGANSNSTGLAAATLAAGGNATAAARAAVWVASLQATTAKAAATPLAGDVGAIAYGPGALSQGLTGGGVDLDQWRRATAQAVLALSPHTYFALAGTGPGAGVTPPPTTPPTTRPTTRPTTPPRTPTTPSQTTTTAPSTRATSPTTRATSRTRATSSTTRATVPASTGTHLSPAHPRVRHVTPPPAPVPTSQAHPSQADLPPATAGGPSLARQQAAPTPAPAVARRTPRVAPTAPTATPPTTSGPAALEAGARPAGVPARPTLQGTSSTAPVLWAVLAGLLLGGLVTVRPWRRRNGARARWRRPRGRHA